MNYPILNKLSSQGVLCLVLMSCSAQSITASEPACRMFSGQVLEGIYEFDASEEVRQLVGEIADAAGIDRDSFDLRAANVGVAAAVICGDRQKVYYSANTFAGFGGERRDWALRGVLAHEIGHHVLGHTISTESDAQEFELKADQYSGFLLCQLGGTIFDARLGLDLYGSGGDGDYPPLDVRREAVASGWTNALAKNKCPPEARNNIPSPDEGITGLRNTIEINAETALELARRPVLTAARIMIEDVVFEPEAEMTIFADRITFEGRAIVRGPRINVVAHSIDGGTFSADGGDGEAGGRILVAAYKISGTSITARGGAGAGGGNGSNGADGSPGGNGINGKCGMGITGDFRGSASGGPGANGQDGSNGAAGGSGGNGGEIALLTFRPRTLYLDVAGGHGGPGGQGGRGGRGGQGGRGGAGCQGLGGHQPTRPSGADGLPGRVGNDGMDGNPGTEGRIWNRPLGGLDDLRNIIEGADGDLATAIENLRRRATNG